MKKFITAAALTAALFSFTTYALAAETIKGTLEKIDGSFYIVKDESGKTERVHFNDTTKKKGDIKVGAKVELQVDKGHVLEIEAGK